MSIDRYKNNRIVKNDTEEYRSFIERRGLTSITHYGMGGLRYPTELEMANLTIQREEWIRGSALWKLAAQYYNNRPELWWVIAHFNQKPTDHHFVIGDVVYIPLPLDKTLRTFGL